MATTNSFNKNDVIDVLTVSTSCETMSLNASGSNIEVVNDTKDDGMTPNQSLENLPRSGFWETEVYNRFKRTEMLTKAFDDDISDSTGIPKDIVHDDMILLWNHYNSINPHYTCMANWAELRKEETAIFWLNQQGEIESQLTYNSLMSKIESVAIYMKSMGLVAGSRVILCFPPGLGFIVAFYACLFNGLVAVPVYPPTPANQTADIERFLTIRKNAEVSVILTENKYSIVARLMTNLWTGGDFRDPTYQKLGRAKWVCIEEAYKKSYSELFIPQTVYPWTPAFLQFTSGSTSAPKGVVVTHGSLLHNVHVCGNAFGFPSKIDDPQTDVSINGVEFKYFVDLLSLRHSISRRVNGHPVRVFSWLPVYHDMGLIGGTIGPLYGGMQLFQMSPIDFIRRPELWLSGMSKYRCSACAAPNFAFELAVRRTSAETLASMDLSHLCGIICGAEPIKLCTMRKFFKKFSSVGLREEVIIPAYGLAENTLVVSSRKCCYDKPKVLVMDSKLFRKDGLIKPINKSGELFSLTADSIDELNYLEDKGDEYMTLVGCGPMAPEVELVIVNSNGMEVGEGECGEIWFTGASKARGYYKLYEKTKQDFMASCTSLNGHKSDNIYVRSGDSGFLYKGELFIAGRIKDMLIIRGRNFYPQDIEAVLDSIPELRAGCSVSFSNEDVGHEELCVAVEIRDAYLNNSYLSGSSILGSLLPLSIRQKCTMDPRFSSDEEFYEYISQTVASNILRRVNLKISRLFILKGRSIAKTTSGKVRRHAAKLELLGNKTNNGLLYYKIYDIDENRGKGPPLDDVELIESWPSDDLEAKKLFFEEMFEIMMICVPSDVLPKIRSNTELLNEKNNEQIRSFLSSSLSELGMDSPAIVEFGERIKRRIWPEFVILEFELPIKCPTLAHLMLYIYNNSAGRDETLSADVESQMVELTLLELNKDRDEYVSKSIDPVRDITNLCERVNIISHCLPPIRCPSDYKNILLTGCTGSLGSWQLKYLLELFPNIHIYLLIRGSSKRDAFNRLREVEVLQKDIHKYYSRITVLAGDITKVRFGLDTEMYIKLTTIIDIVLHTAADINLFKSYRNIRLINVITTLRIIDFCSTSFLKPLHFASTLGIYPQYFTQFKGMYKDMDIKYDHASVDSMKSVFPPNLMGYPWSKYVCEKLLEKAHSQGLPCIIYRFPLTCMSYQDGKVQKDNLAIPLILASIQEGVVPRSFDIISTTPSDIVACRSVLIAMGGESNKYEKVPILNMTDTTIIKSEQMISWLMELGIHMSVIESSDELIHLSNKRTNSTLDSVMPIIRSPLFNMIVNDESSTHICQPINISDAEFFLQRAVMMYPSICKNLMLRWPNPRDLFKRCFLYMLRENYIVGLEGDALSRFDTSHESVVCSTESSESMSTVMRKSFTEICIKNQLTVKGRIMYSIFSKYSEDIAKEMTLVAHTRPPTNANIILIVGTDKNAVNMLQNLLVISSDANMVRSPTISSCMPKSASKSAAVELLEFYKSIGILGCYQTSALRLANKDVNYDKLVDLPCDDTLLLEMLPDPELSETTRITYGIGSSACTWTDRYHYHKQYLSQKDIYSPETITVFSSDLHLLHIDEFKKVYGYPVIIHVTDSRSESAIKDEFKDFAKSMARALVNTSKQEYINNWMKYQDMLITQLDTLPSNTLRISAQQIYSSPLDSVNDIYIHIRLSGENKLYASNPLGIVNLFEINSKPSILLKLLLFIRLIYEKWYFIRVIAKALFLSNHELGFQYFSYCSIFYVKLILLIQRILY